MVPIVTSEDCSFKCKLMSRAGNHVLEYSNHCVNVGETLQVIKKESFTIFRKL